MVPDFFMLLPNLELLLALFGYLRRYLSFSFSVCLLTGLFRGISKIPTIIEFQYLPDKFV